MLKSGVNCALQLLILINIKYFIEVVSDNCNFLCTQIRRAFKQLARNYRLKKQPVVAVNMIYVSSLYKARLKAMTPGLGLNFGS